MGETYGGIPNEMSPRLRYRLDGGLGGALALGGALRGFLFGVQLRDPASLVAAGLVASALPARRAAALDPAYVLRTE